MRKIKCKGKCESCCSGLRRNPDHIPRHKKHLDFVCKCGSTKFYCKNMCNTCYNQSPLRNTPERKAKNKERYETKKDEYNRNRGLKRNPNYVPRPDRSGFVCKCGSTEYNCRGCCKSCAHKELGYGKKYEKSHKKERKNARLEHPEWQKNAGENYSQKFCNLLKMSSLDICMKWRKIRIDCLKRDNYTCRICGSTKFLQVHHIIHKSKQPLLFFNKHNLITLCEKRCHKDVHGKKLDEKNDVDFQCTFNIRDLCI